MPMENDRYTYRMTWSEEDEEYVGLCAEFPSLSWLAGNQEEALQGIRQLVSDAIEDMRATGETIPEPFAGRKYSGKVLVRVPPHVHRQLVIQAAEAGVSLNRLISSKLSQT
jgi:predicted HicB family RNase H-like nuclease